MNSNRLLMIHLGRILLEEFLAPKGVSVWHLAKDIGVPARGIYEIVQGQRPINADVAHRLAHYFGMSERYWLNLQARYDQLTQTLCLQGPGRTKRLTNSPQISDTHQFFTTRLGNLSPSVMPKFVVMHGVKRDG
jgi:addiction module HigA family antidote